MLSTTKDYICESAIEYKICQQKTTKTTINVSPKQTEKNKLLGTQQSKQNHKDTDTKIQTIAGIYLEHSFLSQMLTKQIEMHSKSI